MRPLSRHLTRRKGIRLAAIALVLGAGAAVLGASGGPQDTTDEVAGPSRTLDAVELEPGQTTVPARRPAPAEGSPEGSPAPPPAVVPRSPLASPGAPPGPTGEPTPARSEPRVLLDVPAPAPIAAPAGVAAGTYRLTARVSGRAERARLLIGGDRVGEYGLDGTREIVAVARVEGPSSSVAVEVTGGSALVERVVLAPVPPAFTTRGRWLLDPSGRRIVLRGVNREGMQVSPTGYNMSAADVGWMRRWGSNVVRLKIGQQYWLPGMCEYDPGYRGRVDDAVSWITGQAMVALLDLARSTRGDPCGEVRNHELPDELSVRFWRDAAARYAGNPGVLFGLYNEPHHIDAAAWRDGAMVTSRRRIFGGDNRPWRGVGMQELYDAIRATGATNPVVVSGNRWGYDLRPALSNPLDGFGIVYGPHVYCDCGGALPPAVDDVIGPAVAEYPVIVAEFGSKASNGTFNRNVIEWSERQGIGWIAFQWSPWEPEAFGLLESWDTYRPNVSGQPVFDALKRAGPSR